MAKAILWLGANYEDPEGRRHFVADYVVEDGAKPVQSKAIQDWMKAGWKIVSAGMAASADHEGNESESTILVLEKT